MVCGCVLSVCFVSIYMCVVCICFVTVRYGGVNTGTLSVCCVSIYFLCRSICYVSVVSVYIVLCAYMPCVSLNCVCSTATHCVCVLCHCVCADGVECMVCGVFSVLYMRMLSVCDVCVCVYCVPIIFSVYVFYGRICCVSVALFAPYVRYVSVFCV